MDLRYICGLSFCARCIPIGLIVAGVLASAAFARTPTPTDGPSPTRTHTEFPRPTATPGFPVLRVTASPNPARSGQRVTLDGSASFAAAGAHWEQDPNDPVRVQIENGDALVASFIAPPVDAATTVRVVLRLSEFVFYAEFITILPADVVQVIVGQGTGPPGGRASFGVMLRPVGLAVTNVRHELGFEPEAAIADRGDGTPDCVGVLQPILESATFAFLPDGCIPGQTCERIRAELTTSAPIPDQAVLYVCQVGLTAEPTDGCIHPLSCAGGEATTADGAPLALSCLDGVVRSQYEISGELNATFRAEPAEPVVGDTVHVTFNVYANGGIPTFGLVGAAPFLTGMSYMNHGGWGDVTFELHADCPGTANLHVWVSYETDLGCPGDGYGNHFYQFVGGETQVFPLRVRDPGTFSVSGVVGQNPDGCLGGAADALTIVLQPLGWRVPSDHGAFVFDGVPPGNYGITVDPRCNPFQCWNGAGVEVTDADVVGISLCPVRRANACDAGDCNGDGDVRIDDLIVAVSAALGDLPRDACLGIDTDASGTIDIAELVRAVAVALAGCPFGEGP